MTRCYPPNSVDFKKYGNFRGRFLFKYDTGHGLVYETVVVMLAISDKARVVSKFSHFVQIFLHIVILVKQQVSEQAVYRKYRGDS